MASDASAFSGSIPPEYDARLGPVLFAGYADDLARRAAALQPGRVLELAAGTGILSRRLRDLLPAACRLKVTDLNPPMLDVARAKFRAGEDVEFEPADAMTPGFADRSFGVVACQFGVMFFPDKRASFREALRMLEPGGAYVFNTWGTLEENAFARIAYGVGARMFPDNPPGFYRVPFSYAEPDTVRADLAAAGFVGIVHERRAMLTEVADPAGFAHGLVFGNPLVADLQQRGVDPAVVRNAIAADLPGALSDGAMPLVAHVYSAHRPY